MCICQLSPSHPGLEATHVLESLKMSSCDSKSAILQGESDLLPYIFHRLVFCCVKLGLLYLYTSKMSVLSSIHGKSAVLVSTFHVLFDM